MPNLYSSLNHTAQYIEILNFYTSSFSFFATCPSLNYSFPICTTFSLYNEHLHVTSTANISHYHILFLFSNFLIPIHPLYWQHTSTSSTFPYKTYHAFSLGPIFEHHIHNHLRSHIQFTTSMLCHRTLFLASHVDMNNRSA
jgi:hypothetical protein